MRAHTKTRSAVVALAALPLLVASACATAPAPAPGSATPSTPAAGAPPPLPPRSLAWSDEFDGPRGGPPDPATWTLQEGATGWGNHELQNYTSDRGNAALDGAGNLVITARRGAGTLPCPPSECGYTSARLTTQGKRSWTFGRVEARIRVPRGAGLWPAFWMLGEDLERVGFPASGEIDVMEIVGDHPEESWASIHGPGYVRKNLTKAFRTPEASALSDDFHTYAVDRSPGEMTFAVDGRPFYRVTARDVGAGQRWVFDKPFHALLNVAVGGDWPKAPPASTPFPASMIVDRVAYFR